jgi:hypothetical protein
MRNAETILGIKCHSQKARTWASREPCALKGASTVRRGGQRNTVRLCALLLPYFSLARGVKPTEVLHPL